MNGKGFTLIELQASLLLTLVTLGSLFLFSFYFWQNHHQRLELLRFHGEVDRFFDWHHQTMRSVTDVKHQGERVVFTGLDGSRTVWHIAADGPTVHGLNLFSSKVSVTLEYRQLQGQWQVEAVIEEPVLKLTRRWRMSYPVLAQTELGALL